MGVLNSALYVSVEMYIFRFICYLLPSMLTNPLYGTVLFAHIQVSLLLSPSSRCDSFRAMTNI